LKVPDICRKSISFDRTDAGWYTPNSCSISDIRPEWRIPGGGVGRDDLTDLSTAIDNAIAYSRHRIAEAERHIKLLEKAKSEL
jgi:hypothetical protein